MPKSSHSSAAQGSEAHESSHHSSTSGSKRWKTLRTKQRWWPFHKRHGSRGGSSVTGSETERSENAEAATTVPSGHPPSQVVGILVNGDRPQRVADLQAQATADTLRVPDQPIVPDVQPSADVRPSVDSQSVGIQAQPDAVAVVEPSVDVPPNVNAQLTVSAESSHAHPVATLPAVSDISLDPPLGAAEHMEPGHAEDTRRPVNLDSDTHSRSSRFYEEGTWDNSETDKTISARGPTGSTTYIPIEDTRPRDSAVPTIPDDDSAGHAKEDTTREEEGNGEADVERTSKGLERYPARVVDMRPPSPEPDEERQRHISEIQTSTQPLTSAPMDSTRPAPEVDSEPTTKKKRGWFWCC